MNYNVSWTICGIVEYVFIKYAVVNVRCYVLLRH
jgi:hypothetical protein